MCASLGSSSGNGHHRRGPSALSQAVTLGAAPVPWEFEVRDRGGGVEETFTLLSNNGAFNANRL